MAVYANLFASVLLGAFGTSLVGTIVFCSLPGSTWSVEPTTGKSIDMDDLDDAIRTTPRWCDWAAVIAFYTANTGLLIVLLTIPAALALPFFVR